MTLNPAINLILFAAFGVFLACGRDHVAEELSTIESVMGQSHPEQATVESVYEQGSDSVSERSAQVASSGIYHGQSSLRERIARADVIARVTLQSVTSSTEQFDTRDALQRPGGGVNDGYVRSVEFTFDVHEYLKGAGGTTLVAVVFGGQSYPTTSEAEAKGPDLLAERDTQWDDRESIVFLESTHVWLPGTSQADRYWLGLQFSYMLDSRHNKKWLPVADPQSSSFPVDDNRRYLIDVPSASLTPTITLGELKTLIAEIEQEVSDGDGSEAYRECIADKYRRERVLQHNLKGRQPYQRYASDIGSGLPSGSQVFEDGSAKIWRVQPANRRSQFWLEENDNDLFVAEWPGVIKTARPLPVGEYKYFYLSRLPEFIPCDAYPDKLKRSREHFVTVTASEGTLHELFFDPVNVGSGVSADTANGVLDPASFTNANGTPATIHRMSYDSGTVKIEVTPEDALTGHSIEFIELDGTVSLSLNVDDATEGSITESRTGNMNHTLSWEVSEQPWHVGDKLMMRIR